MASTDGFYDFDKRLRTALRVLAEAPIGNANRSTIQSYLDARRSEGNGTWQIIKTLYHLVEIAKMLQCDFREATRDDLARVTATIEARPFAAWTKNDYKVACRRFYRWLRGTEEYPPEVRWIKPGITGANRKLPEELLTETEVLQMAHQADIGRDRALIVSLYESGCRVGEIGQLKIRHIEFDQHGARLIVRGKTGMRRVRVVRAASLIRKWLEVHPLRENPDAPLWVGVRGQNRQRIMTRDAIARMLSRAAVRAGIKKRIHPHLFRHSRATHLASRLTEAQLKEMFGWTAGSDQAATYVHLSGRNVDDAVLRTYSEDRSALRVKPARCRPTDATTSPWKMLVCLLQDPVTLRFLTKRARLLRL